jgi:hypothetical protein
MRTDFSPKLNLDGGFDPVSGIIGGVQTLAGLGQTIFSGGRKAEKKFNKLMDNAPIYNQNKSIINFYNEALARYNVSPTDSAMYKRQMRDVDRGVTGAVAGLNDRRSGIAGISSILRSANDAKLDANVAAEGEKSRRFGELGGATNMKADEDYKAYYQNVLMPWETKVNASMSKMQGANQRKNAGMANIFGGLQTAGAGWEAKPKKG